MYSFNSHPSLFFQKYIKMSHWQWNAPSLSTFHWWYKFLPLEPQKRDRQYTHVVHHPGLHAYFLLLKHWFHCHPGPYITVFLIISLTSPSSYLLKDFYLLPFQCNLDHVRAHFSSFHTLFKGFLKYFADVSYLYFNTIVKTINCISIAEFWDHIQSASQSY